MPKKRFTPQYSKPASTVHPSLNSGASSSSNNHNDAPPTVNDLITTLRKSNLSTSSPAPTTTVTPTLPPQIRHLLSQPETPIPRARDRRQRFDANGRRLPAGPAPPRSWLQGSRHAPGAVRRGVGKERMFPHSIHHLPGLNGDGVGGRRLQDMCLRTMAREWEFVSEYERNNLADLPTGVRGLLLSNIAVYGPEEGVGSDGLNNLILGPEGVEREAGASEGFGRLDLSGSVGRSISFKQIIQLLQKPTTPPPSDSDVAEMSWEDSISRSISPIIPHLKHLSLSHPPSSISWPRLLVLAKHIPTLTHLSLAFWPVPSLTPNAKTAVMSSKYARDIQYSGTNYYSHSLDEDFREAGMVLKMLAARLYGLEYLDLEGCAEWLQALRWSGDDGGIEWNSQWVRMETMKAGCGYALREESEIWEVEKYTQYWKAAELLQRYVSREVGKGRWVAVERDDWSGYEGFWRGGAEEKRRKRRLIEVLMKRERVEELDALEGAPAVGDVERRSVWEQ